jgi:uncharacterized membrane protein YbhN (UPF0104 family)
VLADLTQGARLTRQAPAWGNAAAALLSIGVAVVLILTLDRARLWSAVELSPREPLPVVAAAAAYTSAFWLKALAWQRLLVARVPAGRLFSILQAGLFLNHALPLKAGEVSRPYLAAKHGVPAMEAVSTTLVARIADFAALALIATVALSFGPLPLAASIALGIATAALIATALVLVTAGFWTPSFLPGRLADLLAGLRAALRGIGPSRLVEAAPLVLLSWLLEGAVLLSAAHLLDTDLSLRLAIGATAFTVLFQVVHITPGGIGVYETSMTSVLALHGVPADEALTLAVLTHALKFAYSFAVGGPFFVFEGVSLLRGQGDRPKSPTSFEVAAARAWNAVNEGKPFTVVFSLAVLVLLSVPDALSPAYWASFAVALGAVVPLYLVFARYDFPLKLRAALWVYLAVFLVAFRFVDVPVVGLVVALYLTFTVLIWGTLYYHLRIGTRWTNFMRFWRLVLENPDPTSGNFQEQVPKLLIIVLAVRYLTNSPSWQSVLGIEAITLCVAVSAVLLHQWLFTWVPALPQPLKVVPAMPRNRISRRFILIAIDGCRADRLREAATPCIDRLRTEGTEFTDVATVYPARTVTCFSSMLTGAPASAHGMRSNFVPDLGIKCESVFDVLRRHGLKRRMVGIAHLIDAFGHDDVRSVTAVMHNDEIDDALIEQAKSALDADDLDLLVLQLLSVDQTGHARGSYRDEYLKKIEETDRKIERFLDWCRGRGYLDGATVLITSDHGQGIGIGGHGHMSPPEINIPCILWGEGVEAGMMVGERRFITDVAATVSHYLGVEQPSRSVGRPLVIESAADERPLVYVLPARDESASLPAVLRSIAASAPAGSRVVVVDDGSTDSTAAIAAAHGAVVVSHESTRGLGAALRGGLQAARSLNARAAVYLDADGEYDPGEAAKLLAPIEAGDADYVLGSRFRGHVEGMPLYRRAGNHCFSLLLSLLCGRWISDGQTGFRAFSRRALDVAEIVHDYNYAQVLTMDLLHKGMRLRQVPVCYRRRRQGRSFISPQYLWRVPLGMAREVLRE